MRALGAVARWERDSDGAWALRVDGCGGRPERPADGVIHAGNAGAALRLLLGIGALLPEVRFETDHPDSLGRRPNADLLDALRALGVKVEAREPGGLLPITLRGGPPFGGAVSVSGALQLAVSERAALSRAATARWAGYFCDGWAALGGAGRGDAARAGGGGRTVEASDDLLH